MADKLAPFKNVATAMVSEAVGAVPGGSTALSIVQQVFSHRARARATELFQAIGVQTGASDWEEAASQLSQHVGKPWFDEAIEAGFFELMSTTDSEVRACIGVLVAEYVANQKAPDIAFRRVGALLRDSDARMLPTLWTIAVAYAELLPNAERQKRVLMESRRRPNAPIEFWIETFRHEPRGSVYSTRYSQPDNLPECTRALVGAGIGHNWTGMGGSSEGQPMIYFEQQEDAKVTLILRCLQTWLAHKQTAASQETHEDGTDPDVA